MASKLKWDGDRVRGLIMAEMKRRIEACTIIVANRARELLSVAGTGIYHNVVGENIKRGKRAINALRKQYNTGEGSYANVNGKMKRIWATKTGKLVLRRPPRRKKS